jgi:phosphonate transport system ATP-binding protein
LSEIRLAAVVVRDQRTPLRGPSATPDRDARITIRPQRSVVGRPSRERHRAAIVPQHADARLRSMIEVADRNSNCFSPSPSIAFAGVTKAFGATRALDRVSAVIPAGQFVAIIGRSGAGKTTLLRSLSGEIPVTDGTIRFGMEDLSTLRGQAIRDHRAAVGMIYQQFNLVKRLRVLDNVRIGRLAHQNGWHRWAALAQWFDADDTAIALRCLAHVGLADRVWQRTDSLSGGEQQRVAIAKVLAQAPVLVLADEPVASLDVANGGVVMDTLRHVVDSARLTVIATLHGVDYARRYADRILGLRGGRLVFDGAPADLDDQVLAQIFGDAPARPALAPLSTLEYVTP